MSSSSEDSVVASLGDSLLRESDVMLLDGPFWLNDRLIGFYFEHLHQSDFKGSDKILFFSPEVSQFLKLVSKEEIPVFVDSLALDEKELILMAINNASDPSQPGGSHWSLLIYSSQSQHFYHFDSSPGMNEDSAFQTAKKIHNFLAGKERDKGNFAYFGFHFSDVPVIKQTNGYDCGIHVLLNAEHASRHFLLYGGPKGLDPVDPAKVKEMRQRVKQVIFQYPAKPDR